MIYDEYKKQTFPKLLESPNDLPEDKPKIKELLKKPDRRLARRDQVGRLLWRADGHEPRRRKRGHPFHARRLGLGVRRGSGPGSDPHLTPVRPR